MIDDRLGVAKKVQKVKEKMRATRKKRDKRTKQIEGMNEDNQKEVPLVKQQQGIGDIREKRTETERRGQTDNKAWSTAFSSCTD